MTSKKDNSSNFKSIRIFGKNAQKFLITAKKKIKEASQRDSAVEEKMLKKEKIPEKVIMEISTGSVVRATFSIVGIILMFLFLYAIWETIFLFLLAVFLAVVIDPGVTFMNRWRLPRGISVLLVYFVFITLVGFLIFSIVPILAGELNRMSIRIAEFIDRFLSEPDISFGFVPEGINDYLNTLMQQIFAEISTGGSLDMLKQFGERLSVAAQGSLAFIVALAGSVIAFVIDLVLVLVLAFFLQLEKDRVLRWARKLFPHRYKSYVEGKAEAIHAKLAQWIRGQLMLSGTIAVLVYVALLILGMPYPLTLALLAGFTEFIPVVGPILAAIPSVFIALSTPGMGFFFALIVGLVYYGIQWCENNLLVPIIMRRAVGLSPIAILLAMLIGVSFPDYIHPILGVMLAIPVATIFSLFIKDYTSRK